MRTLVVLFLAVSLGIPAALYHWHETRSFEIQIPGAASEHTSWDSAGVSVTLASEKPTEHTALVAEASSLEEAQVSLLTEAVIPEFEVNIQKEKRLGRINQMSVSDWIQIKGIGMVTAQRILDYKASIRTFTTLEQLLDVKGIGPAKYAAILEWLDQP